MASGSKGGVGTWDGDVSRRHQPAAAAQRVGTGQPDGQRQRRKAAGGKVSGRHRAVLQRVPHWQVRRRRQHPPGRRGNHLAVIAMQRMRRSCWKCQQRCQHWACRSYLLTLAAQFLAGKVHVKLACMPTDTNDHPLMFLLLA